MPAYLAPLADRKSQRRENDTRTPMPMPCVSVTALAHTIWRRSGGRWCVCAVYEVRSLTYGREVGWTHLSVSVWLGTLGRRTGCLFGCAGLGCPPACSAGIAVVKANLKRVKVVMRERERVCLCVRRKKKRRKRKGYVEWILVVIDDESSLFYESTAVGPTF